MGEMNSFTPANDCEVMMHIEPKCSVCCSNHMSHYLSDCVIEAKNTPAERKVPKFMTICFACEDCGAEP